jgi:hypothetical protein
LTTHSIATLAVSEAAYAEIKEKLLAAGYGHAVMADGQIDMSGIGVVAQPGRTDDERDAARWRQLVKSGIADQVAEVVDWVQFVVPQSPHTEPFGPHDQVVNMVVERYPKRKLLIYWIDKAKKRTLTDQIDHELEQAEEPSERGDHE